MNWYVVYLLFAQPESDDVGKVVCESRQVLFSAPSALAAYDKGTAWATEHIAGSEFQLVGVEHIQSLDEEPGDGVEIGGTFYESDNIWQRQSELIPEKASIRAILWEQNMDVPVGQIMEEEQKGLLKRLFKQNES